MIIRFRCYHCQHLFGIAVEIGGRSVDCPHCGRSLRVPKQDGIASPQRNRKAISDRSVMEACELLQQSPTKRAESADADFSQTQKQTRETPTDTNSLSGLNNAFQLLEELQPSTAIQTDLDSEETVSLEKNISHNQWGLTKLSVIVVLLLFIVGAWWGSFQTENSTAPTSEFALQPKQAKAVEDAAVVQNNVQTPSSQYILRGRIRYRTVDGTFTADSYARVFLIPESPKSADLMSLQGTLQSDSNQQHRLASEHFYKLGGGFAVADEVGEYELQLPSVGKYYAIVLSAKLKQKTSLSSDWHAVLSNYFANPDKLVAESKSQIKIVDVTEAQSQTFDLDFERS